MKENSIYTTHPSIHPSINQLINPTAQRQGPKTNLKIQVRWRRSMHVNNMAVQPHFIVILNEMTARRADVAGGRGSRDFYRRAVTNKHSGHQDGRIAAQDG